MSVASAVILALASLVPFSLGGICLLFGAQKGYIGIRYATGAHPETTPPPSEPAAVSSGHAAVTGTVRPGPDGTVTAPLSGTEAVAYRLRIEQRDDRGEWLTVAEYAEGTRFSLEGATDRLSVDPSGTEPTLEPTRTVDTGPDDTLSIDVRTRFEESDRIDLAATPEVLATTTDEHRRYEEATLEPGETAYVYGKCLEVDEEGTDGSARIDESESSTFRYGTRAAVQKANERELSGPAMTAALFVQGLVTLLFGLVFVGFGVFVLSDAIEFAAAWVIP